MERGSISEVRGGGGGGTTEIHTFCVCEGEGAGGGVWDDKREVEAHERGILSRGAA
jgi:hypothetical protein